MLRLPKGVSPAPGRGGTALPPPPPPPPPHHPKKVMSMMGSVERGGSSLGSPPLPTGSFTQLYTPAAVSFPAPRGGGLYATPQGPQLRILRSASAGRLPVRCLHPIPAMGIASVGRGGGGRHDGGVRAGWGAGGRVGLGDPKMRGTVPFQIWQLVFGVCTLRCLFGGGVGEGKV